MYLSVSAGRVVSCGGGDSNSVLKRLCLTLEDTRLICVTPAAEASHYL